MVQILALFFILTLSMFIVRAGGLALCRTGLSREAAMFQSQSAFMGVGFTTSESEVVVDHPVRRRIIRALMLLGFVSVTSTMSTLVVTFMQPRSMNPLLEIALVGGGIALLWTADRFGPVQRLIDRSVTRALESATDLEAVDYEELMNLRKGYAVGHVTVEEGSWLVHETLRALRLADEGLLVLSIERQNGTTIATPEAETELQVGDRLLCYGQSGTLVEVGERRGGQDGDRVHENVVREHQMAVVEERIQDETKDAAADRESPHGGENPVTGARDG